MAFIDLLKEERLTLLSPSKWFDQNDALGLEAFGAARGEGSVYAACFAMGSEQAHHWQLFAGNEYGVCLVFDHDEVKAHLDTFADRILHAPVVYCGLEQVAKLNPIPSWLLAFLKRDTFKAEEEYRVVAWQESFFAEETYTLPFPRSLVKRLVFGPSMPDTFINTLVRLIKETDPLSEIDISKSRLVNNASWSRAIKKATSAGGAPK